MKLLFDPKQGKIWGAQAVGRNGVDKRIDLLAMAIRSEITVFDLEDTTKSNIDVLDFDTRVLDDMKRLKEFENDLIAKGIMVIVWVF